jgi:8-amino-7-oxononanoate synthase
MKDSLIKWQTELAESLQKLKADNRYRQVKALKKLPVSNLTETFAGNCDFSSNDYLSLNSDGIIHQFYLKLLQNPDSALNLTSGSTGSRLLSGQSEIFDDAEKAMSDWTGYESSLLFSSGYNANIGVMDALFTARDFIFTDRQAHASLLDGIRLSGAKKIYYKHNDLNDLELHLRKTAREDSRSRFWIVTESVFSMDGDSPDLTALLDLAEKYNALLYIDEAHAVGLFGEYGAGLTCQSGIRERIAVCMMPMGKAPGLSGAFVCGSPTLKEYLINHSRSFIFSTAPLPVLPFLLKESIQYMKTKFSDEDRTDLQVKAEGFRRRLHKAGVSTLDSSSQIVPILVQSEEKVLLLKEHLQKSGYIVSAIRPPTVAADSCRLRISICKDHTEKQLEDLAEMIIGEMNI